MTSCANLGAAALLVLTLVLLPGCAGLVVEGAGIAADKVTVSNNIDAAERGDPEAQYKVGDAYCCSVTEGGGFYNTPKSLTWLCVSAAQGYGPAMAKIGKIYSGDVIDGIRVVRRAAQGVVGNSKNLPVAYAWLHLAASRNVADARGRADDVFEGMTERQRAEAADLVNGVAPLQCEWDAVIGSGT